MLESWACHMLHIPGKCLIFGTNEQFSPVCRLKPNPAMCFVKISPIPQGNGEYSRKKWNLVSVVEIGVYERFPRSNKARAVHSYTEKQ